MKHHSLFAAYTLVAGCLLTAPFSATAEDDDEPRRGADTSMSSNPGSAAQAGSSPQSSGAASPNIPASEKPMLEETRDFVVNAAKGNMGEAMLGETAQNKASSDAVKEYAQKIAEDHRKANEQLKTIAQQTDIQWPSELRPPHHDLAQSLKNLEGKEFDEKFANHMVQEHEREVQKYERLAQTVGNKDLQNYINSTLPVLRAHLEEAKQLQQQLSTAAR